VLFTGHGLGLREHEELVRKHFATVIPPEDNKFAALNSAVWSGGSFIYVPKGVKVDIPLQAYFRINAQNMGQFERTLIIADEGSRCTTSRAARRRLHHQLLHSAVVELIAMPGARIRYTTIQNWSNNVYNLVTKRAFAYEDAVVEWVDGNIGSKLTMKYPAIYLMGERAHGEVLSIAFAGDGQHQDAGAKMIHAAPNTTSRIISKSISRTRAHLPRPGQGGQGRPGCRTSVECDALLIGEQVRSDTYPTMEIAEDDVRVEHEARVSKLGEEQLFYLQSRGLEETRRG
jgi:Fe-S cluster assembly protein SufB